MKYSKSQYKYQLDEDEIFQTSFRPARTINTRFLTLTRDGVLTVRAGYAWDGMSGPVRDTVHNHHAGLCHDALYQLMRMGHIGMNRWVEADLELAKLCTLYGTSKFWVNVYMVGLKLAKGKYAKPKHRKKIYHITSKAM